MFFPCSWPMSNPQNEQNVFGGEVNQVNNPTAPVITGKDSTVNINY